MNPRNRAQASGSRNRRVLVVGGRVWGETGPQDADVLIEDGRIAAVGKGLAPRADTDVLDARGLDVLPGFMDIHVHASDRIGRFTLADTWQSAARAALPTGVTTLFGFATQRPGETLLETVARCRRRAVGAGCEVWFHLTPTCWPWPWGEVERLLARGVRTFKLYTTYREAGLCTSYERLAEVMRRLAPLGGRLLVHCEDEAVLATAAVNGADLGDPFTHARQRPPAAEVEAIRRVTELAGSTGCPTHVVHVSTAEGASLVAAARSAGAPVSCETAPHYLVLSDEWLRRDDGHRFLCTPPLRAEAIREALVERVLAGAVDCLATDHCAFRRADKDVGRGDIRAVPNGLPGVGALVPLTYDVLVERHGVAVGAWAALLSAGPARAVGLAGERGTIRPGARGDLVLLARAAQPQPVRASLAPVHDPYSQAASWLSVRWVVHDGRVVVRPAMSNEP